MNRSIQTFFELVHIDSPSGEEERVADYIIQTLKNKVDFIEKDTDGNVFAQLNGIGEPILFAAHMDTAEPGRGIKPMIKDEYIVSDGRTILGADNKVAVAAIVETIERIKEENIMHRPVELLFTYSEEVNSYGAISFDYGKLKSKTGVCFDRTAPIGTIVTASPFYDRFDITIIGKAAHASLPDNGINVLSIFDDFLKEMKLGKIDENTVFNIGVVKCGDVRNTIPGELTIKGEIRSFVEKTMQEQEEKVKETLQNLDIQYHSTHTVDIVRENGGYIFESPEAETFLQFISEKMGLQKIKPFREEVWGVSDANIFNEKNLIMVNLGNGAEMAHAKTERVNLKEYEKLIQLMIALLQN